MAAGKAIGCFGLTEPDVGSDPAGMKTRATKDGSDWILNGAKMSITNSPVSDVMVVWAKTDEVNEKTGEKGVVRGFVVPSDTPAVDDPRGPAEAVAARVDHR